MRQTIDYRRLRLERLSLGAERRPMWKNLQRQFLILDLAMVPLVICLSLSDTLRSFALYCGSSYPTKADTERHKTFLSKLGRFSLSSPELTRCRFHLILDAGATSPNPRLFPPARCIKGQTENECPLPAPEGSEAHGPQAYMLTPLLWVTHHAFLPFLIWPSKTCSLRPESSALHPLLAWI